MKHKLFSRFIGVLLAVVMLASLVSMPSLANTVPETDTTVAEQTQTVEQDQTVTDGTDGEVEGESGVPAAEGDEDTTLVEGDDNEATPSEDGEESSAPTEGGDEETTPAGDDSEEGTEPSEGGEEPAEPAEDSTEGNASSANSGEPTGDGEETAEPADIADLTGEALLDALLAIEDDETLSATMAQLTTEQLESLQALDAESLKALDDRFATPGEQVGDGIPTETPELTTVGPLLQVASSASYAKPMMRSAARVLVQQNTENEVTTPVGGLQLSKDVSDTADENGVYEISLHAAAESKIVTTSSPCDIILVLDRSRSMRDDGKDTALIDAAESFVDTIKANSPQSRVAVVGYANNSTIYSGTGRAQGAFVSVSDTAALYEDIKSALSEPDGGTYSNKGLHSAYDIYQAVGTSDANYNNARAVVLFTDGIPGTGEWGLLSYSCAQDSINWAHALKGSKGTDIRIARTQAFYSGYTTDFIVDNSAVGCGATVYTVGVFPGSDDDYQDDSEKSSSANKINEYMYRVSSHRSDGSHVGTWPTGEDADYWYPNMYTRNQPNGYYLTTETAAGLTEIFDKIAHQTGKPIENATVKDYISPYFDLVDENGSPLSVGDTVQAGTYAGTVKNDATRDVLYVEWTEVTLEPQSADGTVPAKEFDATLYVKPKDKFMGGNGVPTNVYGPSGVYDENNKCIGSFDECTVDVPVKGDFTVEDQSIYLSQSADPNAMVKYAETGARPGENLGYDAKSNDFVTITYTITGGDKTGTYTIQNGKSTGTLTGDLDLSGLTTCTNYTVTCMINDKTVNSSSVDNTAAVHVYVPTVTWQDSKKNYGDTVTDNTLTGENGNLVEVSWSDAKQDYNVEPTGTEPTLSYTFSYNPNLEYDAEDQVSKITKETVVTVTDTKIGGQSYTVQHEWEEDTGVCSCEEEPGENQFRIHLNTGSLTINKTFYKMVNGEQVTDQVFATSASTFLFEVKSDSATYYVAVDVANNTSEGSAVLKNIPTGSYTVTEIAWPNGYEGASEQQVEVRDNTSFVTFEDEVVAKDYTHDDGVVINNFTHNNGGWQWTKKTS